MTLMVRKISTRSNTPTPFQARVLQSLRDEGLVVRKILRIYPAGDMGSPLEVLFVSMDGQAGTCWVDANGKLQIGPVAGFGPLA